MSRLSPRKRTSRSRSQVLPRRTKGTRSGAARRPAAACGPAQPCLMRMHTGRAELRAVQGIEQTQVVPVKSRVQDQSSLDECRISIMPS